MAACAVCVGASTAAVAASAVWVATVSAAPLAATVAWYSAVLVLSASTIAVAVAPSASAEADDKANAAIMPPTIRIKTIAPTPMYIGDSCCLAGVDTVVAALPPDQTVAASLGVIAAL